MINSSNKSQKNQGLMTNTSLIIHKKVTQKLIFDKLVDLSIVFQ